MDRQAVFNKVYRHLLTQGAKSETLLGCAYRGGYGLMCAIGCLIDDAHYDPDWNYSDVDAAQDALAASLECSIGHKDLAFLRRLQGVHDDFDVGEWPDRLARYAQLCALTVPTIPDSPAPTP